MEIGCCGVNVEKTSETVLTILASMHFVVSINIYWINIMRLFSGCRPLYSAERWLPVCPFTSQSNSVWWQRAPSSRSFVILFPFFFSFCLGFILKCCIWQFGQHRSHFVPLNEQITNFGMHENRNALHKCIVVWLANG